MNIVQAMRDRNLLGSLFKNPASWHAWEIYLSALFALPIDAADMGLFQRCTGLTRPPVKRARESFVVCGRRSGKSFISSIIAVYLACFKDWTPYLSPGERGWIFVIANDKNQAGIIKAYISGILHGNRLLKAKIERETKEEIELSGSVGIAVKTSSFRTLRGYTLLAAILEEMAYYRSEEDSANPDREILAAVRPALATIPESVLLGISTPYSRSGVLWEQYKANFGKEGGLLIWLAPTRTMNPTIDSGLIENALKEDPQAARAEWLGEWRTDIQAFISAELIDAVTIPGRFELPRLQGVQYFGFIDPSSGRQDSFCCAISHREKSGLIVLDVLRERRPPFPPESAISEFSDLLSSFGISEVEADRYAIGYIQEAFQKHGIMVKNSVRTASELYLDFLPLISNGTVELLDNKRLHAQLTGLERRTRSGGKDLVTHYPGGHDDLCNSVAGSCAMASRVFFRDDIFSMNAPRRSPLGPIETLQEEFKLRLLGEAPDSARRVELSEDEQNRRELEEDEAANRREVFGESTARITHWK